MDATEENTQEVETPVVEKVKKERSILQQQVLANARARGLEVRLEKAKDRKEAKERALQEVVEKYKKKEEEVEPEVEKFEPEPEVDEVVSNKYFDMYTRLGKTGSFGPWSRVIVYCRSVRMLPVIPYAQRNTA